MIESEFPSSNSHNIFETGKLVKFVKSTKNGIQAIVSETKKSASIDGNIVI